MSEINLCEMSNDDLKSLIASINDELASRVENTYYEITLESNQYKGSGKCWVQAVEDGKRGGFVDPYNVVKTDKYRTEKTYRLSPGKYLVNTVGSKSQDKRYYLVVAPDFTASQERL